MLAALAPAPMIAAGPVQQAVPTTLELYAQEAIKVPNCYEGLLGLTMLLNPVVNGRCCRWCAEKPVVVVHSKD